ncbi:unnamed protein product, partial [Iphiclides podalirius]
MIRNKEGESCSLCRMLRRSFLLVAVSAVIPIVGFTALIMSMDLGEMELTYKNVRSALVESVAGLLHVQLFLATAVLIAGMMRKRRLMNYRKWYLVCHVAIMTLSFLLSLGLTLVNDSYALFCVTVLVAALYFYVVHRLLTVLRFKMAM